MLLKENGSVVSLPLDLQDELGLDRRAGLDPDDNSRALYLVAGFHQLHCLVSLVSHILSFGL
jgi:hypothetical protein